MHATLSELLRDRSRSDDFSMNAGDVRIQCSLVLLERIKAVFNQSIPHHDLSITDLGATLKSV